MVTIIITSRPPPAYGSVCRENGYGLWTRQDAAARTPCDLRVPAPPQARAERGWATLPGDGTRRGLSLSPGIGQILLRGARSPSILRRPRSHALPILPWSRRRSRRTHGSAGVQRPGKLAAVDGNLGNRRRGWKRDLDARRHHQRRLDERRGGGRTHDQHHQRFRNRWARRKGARCRRRRGERRGSFRGRSQGRIGRSGRGCRCRSVIMHAGDGNC